MSNQIKVVLTVINVSVILHECYMKPEWSDIKHKNMFCAIAVDQIKICESKMLHEQLFVWYSSTVKRDDLR